MTIEPKKCFYILGKPLNIVDAINRRAAATGSIRYAMAAGDADYNGHPLSLYWNDYRRYYLLDYHWGERVVLHRGEDFAAALTAAKRELARQGRGGTLNVTPRDQDLPAARADADLKEGRLYEMPYPYHPAPDAWKFKLLSEAALFNLNHLLVNAKSPAEWEAGRASRLTHAA